MEFEIPESLTGLDITALAGLRLQAVEAFDALKADPNLDAAGLARLKDLAGFVKTVDDQTTTLQTEADARQAEIEALNAQIHGGGDEPEPVDDNAEGGDTEGDGDNPDGGTAEPVLEGELVPAGASAGKSGQGMGSVAKAAAAQRKPAARGTSAKAARVLASANVANRPMNSAFKNARDLADAFSAAFNSFPNAGGQAAAVATRLTANIARIELPFDEEFVLGGGRYADDWDLIDAVCDQKRLQGGNLIAAGVWCALNERIWDLCPGLETTAGIWDIPGFTLRRPGVQYPGNIDFRDLWNLAGLGFVWTETVQPQPKACAKLPCPTFPEWRMEVDGLCILQDIIAQAMWPEWTRDVIRRVPSVHAHKINARLLARAFAAFDGVTNPAGSTVYPVPAAGMSDIDGDIGFTGVLAYLGLAATHVRYQYRADDNLIVEGVAPMWFREWIRTDVSRRNNMALWEVSDQQIDNWLLRRKIRLQWVYDLQDGYVDATGFGGTTPPTTWPETVKILLYPAGTYSQGSRPIIDLQAVYDSANLAKNEYIAVFSEQATLLVKRCYSSYMVTLNLCPTGAGPLGKDFTCGAGAAALEMAITAGGSGPEAFDVTGSAADAAALNAGTGDGGESDAAKASRSGKTTK